ncbi:DUF389 domain-containing protein [Rhodococcus sp. D2-41]|uniref:DUF389 domain-containing protein n=1 Tax=Speluncibacter jeojiensis TaxID=2710754 RepID=A0A9X4REF1_9ACTN|nr:DUF389 domain-containing protein [Rhodococcus sp. D2-41]MDG3011288.1 DUF389 domain-containing protein [Rhodococcus sp. D2-41]MDG3015860.1 DUF389 domain-containing protein [Corynebacteriales bacterium D3-21]
MLHLRVICPAERTDAVAELLDDAVGATHVVVLRGVAAKPAGDCVEADVVRESANELLDALESMGLRHTGAITLEPLDTVLSDTADRAAKDAVGDPDDAVVWDQLMAHTKEESTLNATFLAFLTIACLIAAVGVVTDSPVTIVGAMVVGPEFGPLSALAVALVRRSRRHVRRSLLPLIVGFPVAMIITGFATFLGRLLGWVTQTRIENLHQVDFIYEVGAASFVVALLAGAAGMLSLVSAKSAALIGVFISVTTIPAAGFAVVAASVGEWAIAFRSMGQLAVNLTGIVIAGVVVLLARPETWPRKFSRRLTDRDSARFRYPWMG